MHVDSLPSKALDFSKTNSFNEAVDSSLIIREEYRQFFKNIQNPKLLRLREKAMSADLTAYLEGFTYNVNPNEYNAVPMDFVPRIIDRKKFQIIEDGIKQRANALNLFLKDVYTEQKTIIPDDLIFGSEYFNPELIGHLPKNDIFIQVYGADLLYNGVTFYVIEDNLRVPSGVTYPLKIREMSDRYLNALKKGYKIEPFKPWKSLLETMKDSSWVKNPFMVLLTDGPSGSAYFEHMYLSKLMNIPLVEAGDLYVTKSGHIAVRVPGEGEIQVDVIYRRVEDIDEFVPGLTKAYLDGKVALVNSPGTGVADDKLVYSYVPELIRHYLSEDPILEQPKSYNPTIPEELENAILNIENLVVKERGGYGGMGTVIPRDHPKSKRGPLIEKIKKEITEKPDDYLLQETLDFSTTVTRESFSPLIMRDSYVDLRVFSYYTKEGPMVPAGGLSRYARHGRITNNSSGGGVKDTWIVNL
ncbi:MAG: circularly permuted type 2 ATP-grasp protein [Nitrosopumilus sp.]|uniref:circularly permuted type 2 ATP-grasp protein n=1 Tax=Nitrosopumilus sp. TaxID=2024843 RepID=UPI00247290BF|nr:circularly permuted type 2 ATP-grasp protein [Nitrosopumilus sp.]MDH5430737.1 circularly permuted type 2 ATP-grasp protein [Nitrosopumilus sp.]